MKDAELHMYLLMLVIYWCVQASIDAEVKVLLALKSEYKSVTGAEWKPGAAPAGKEADANKASTVAAQLQESNVKVQELKATKADKVRFFHQEVYINMK